MLKLFYNSYPYHLTVRDVSKQLGISASLARAHLLLLYDLGLVDRDQALDNHGRVMYIYFITPFGAKFYEWREEYKTQ